MNGAAHECPRLFEPLRLKGLELPNRCAVAPMTRISATAESTPTERMARYYHRFARGGFGLVITEGIYTDQAYAQGYPGQPGLGDPAQAAAWRPLVRRVHADGGRIFAQLMHAGALSQANRYRDDTVGPSAIRPKGAQMPIYGGEGAYRMPRAMTTAEIGQAIDGFARAARLACEVAGFDGVEIHGANGYLLDQFLTDYSNRRTDDWGGDLERRIRLSVEVARAVRRAVGDGVPVGIRISQAKVNDFAHRWAEAAHGAATVFARLAASGVDYFHITEFEAWRPAFDDEGPSLVGHARRAAPDVTIIANGGLHDPTRAVQLLDEGADLIAIGRGALANPDWPRRVAAAHPLQPFDPSVLAPLADIKPGELVGKEWSRTAEVGHRCADTCDPLRTANGTA
jgi:2,4-dienoyl-CoA reductase-like NADH-dependent reductase (Old Yellow Enzyme family)